MSGLVTLVILAILCDVGCARTGATGDASYADDANLVMPIWC